MKTEETQKEEGDEDEKISQIMHQMLTVKIVS